MKRLLVVAMVGLFSTPALADEVYDACVQAGETNGRPEGVSADDYAAACTCLAEKASGNADLSAELLALSKKSSEEIEAQQSEAAQEAIQTCLSGGA